MKAETIIENIIDGNFSVSDLANISDAVRSAQDLAKQQTAAKMKATLKIGDKVKLTGLRPKSINGLIATVAGMRRTRVNVDMPKDYRAGRWSEAKGIGVPLSCVVKV
jgi:hypothetical protein